jgi:hypothetical protein
MPRGAPWVRGCSADVPPPSLEAAGFEGRGGDRSTDLSPASARMPPRPGLRADEWLGAGEGGEGEEDARRAALAGG